MKKNDLVTAKVWYMSRRVYGKIVDRDGSFMFIQGKFGLERFHKSTVRVVKKRK